MNKDKDFLRLTDVKVHFPVRGGVFRRCLGVKTACEQHKIDIRVSLHVLWGY